MTKAESALKQKMTRLISYETDLVERGEQLTQQQEDPGGCQLFEWAGGQESSFFSQGDFFCPDQEGKQGRWVEIHEC